MSQRPTLAYRPDVDGLRAIAVVPVLLFHAGLGCPGGYVGVDIFFVISGFLIGSLVLKEIEAGTFRMADFWERRIRRIFPALAAVVVATLIAGSFWLVPEHFEDFGKSVIAQPTLAANFYFWRQSGYFDTASEFQPLLHTWSLAVEEQFYLLFPPLILLLMKWGRKAAFIATLVCIAASFLFSLYATVQFPSLSFFLIPSRAWELNFGVILALLPAHRFLSGKANELLSWLGFGLILWAIFFYDINTPFPGLAAIPPCLGTALLIYSHTRKATTVSRILSAKPLVFIGKISYSLYLWHWPILVFVKYLSFTEVSALTLSLALAASTLLSILSWKFLETPFRKKTLFPTRKGIFLFGGITGAIFVILGTVVYKLDGISSRFPPEVVRHKRIQSDFDFIQQLDALMHGMDLPTVGAQISETSQPKAMVWGDSHVMAALPGIDEFARELDLSLYAAVMPGKAPIAGVHIARDGKNGTDYGTPVLQFILENNIEHVILTAHWNIYAFGMPGGDLRILLCDDSTFSRTTEQAEKVFVRNLRKTIRTMNDAGVKVTLMRDVGFQPRDVPATVAQAASRGLDLNAFALPLEEHRAYQQPINNLIDEAVKGLEVDLIDPLPCFTDSDGTYLMAKDGKVLYNDRHHVSPYGATFLRSVLYPVLERAAK